MDADVIVVGAGLAGLVATAELARAGRRVFLLDQLTPDQAREYLQSLRRHAEDEHARYVTIRDSHDWTEGDDDFFGRAALEYGLRATAMQADWASWALEQLGRRRNR